LDVFTVTSRVEPVTVTPPLLRGLVHGLDGLKRQRHAQRRDALAVLVILAIPDEFGHGNS
jgi:hypothetical protein